MNALKNYAVLVVVCTLAIGMCSSVHAKDNPSKDNVPTATVTGADGNKKEGSPDKNQNVETAKTGSVAPSGKMPGTVTKEIGGNKKDVLSDRNQDKIPVKAGSATPVGQMQATDLRRVEELSCAVQEMLNSMMTIGSKQDELRTEIHGFTRVARNGNGPSVVSLFAGTIAVILILMGIVGGVWFLNGQIAKQLCGIKTNSSGVSFDTEEIKQTIVETLQSFLGKENRTVTAIVPQSSINDIKASLGSKLSSLAEQYFGTKVANLNTAIDKFGESTNKMEQLLASVNVIEQKSQGITSSAESLEAKIEGVIGSLDVAMTKFSEDVGNAATSFCNAEAVSVLPKVQRLIEDLGGTLTKTNSELAAKVGQLEEGVKESKKTIGDRDDEIKQLKGERDARGEELRVEQDKHKTDNENNVKEISRLKDRITELQKNTEEKANELDGVRRSLGDEQRRREGVEAAKGELEEVIAKRDEWNQSLFPSWFKDQVLKSLHDTLCSEFVSESPSMECLLFRAALLELKAMELKGVPDGIESLLTRLGRYCFAYLNEKKCEMKYMFEFGKKIATLVSESDMVKPTGVYVRVPRMGGQVDLQWMRSSSNERTIQTIRTWSVWTKNGLSSRAEVN